MLSCVDVYFLIHFTKQLQRVSQQAEIIIGYMIRYAPEIARESATWRNRYHLAEVVGLLQSRVEESVRRGNVEKLFYGGDWVGEEGAETSNAPVD